MTVLSSLYGRATALRRSWYARDRSRSRRLQQPVISVGNLALGGSGKTPVVAALARMLVAAGERPSILSRGYRRPDPSSGVVVVSDGQALLAAAAQSGDEPFMLARTLIGAAIVVSHNRFEAGTLAETRLGCTVHILDDGFQHVQLVRDVNLLVGSRRDLDDRVVPSGTLREPQAAAGAADVVLVEGSDEDLQAVKFGFGVSTAFRVTRRFHTARAIDGDAVPRQRVMAVAGIARPERFFTALREQGWEIAREIVFRDHHWFSAKDVQTIEQGARDAGAAVVMTTEKDAARLEGTVGRTLTWAVLPVEAGLDERFAPWLAGRLAAARRQRGEPA